MTTLKDRLDYIDRAIKAGAHSDGREIHPSAIEDLKKERQMLRLDIVAQETDGIGQAEFRYVAAQGRFAIDMADMRKLTDEITCAKFGDLLGPLLEAAIIYGRHIERERSQLNLY